VRRVAARIRRQRFESDIGRSTSVLHQMHTLYVLWCISILSAESQILYYVRPMYLHSSIVFWSRHVGRPLLGLVCTSSVFVLSFHDYIFILFISLYISIVYHDLCSVVTLFPLYILSLSIIHVSAWLVIAATVKRAYGQWMVYGEFNTLGFVSSPRLAYKS